MTDPHGVPPPDVLAAMVDDIMELASARIVLAGIPLREIPPDLRPAVRAAVTEEVLRYIRTGEPGADVTVLDVTAYLSADEIDRILRRENPLPAGAWQAYGARDRA